MQIVDKNNITKISLDTLPFIDLDKTFNCGQCFRWKKYNDTWIGIVGDKVYSLSDIKDKSGHYIKTNVTQSDFDLELKTYLDLNTDYIQLNIPSSDTFALEAQKFGSGIRILRQDPWEMLISYIISQRNNIPKIMTTISMLCETYGEEIEIYDINGQKPKNKQYKFPSVSTLAKLDTQDLSGIGLGYRDKYIINAAREVNDGKLDLDYLAKPEVSGQEAIEKLTQLYGVGPKVANCVALFGLHKLDMFPIDVWIQRIIDNYYNGSIDIEQYGNLAGLVQQYMFYYIKFSRRENV